MGEDVLAHGCVRRVRVGRHHPGGDPVVLGHEFGDESVLRWSVEDHVVVREHEGRAVDSRDPGQSGEWSGPQVEQARPVRRDDVVGEPGARDVVRSERRRGGAVDDLLVPVRGGPDAGPQGSSTPGDLAERVGEVPTVDPSVGHVVHLLDDGVRGGRVLRRDGQQALLDRDERSDRVDTGFPVWTPRARLPAVVGPRDVCRLDRAEAGGEDAERVALEHVADRERTSAGTQHAGRDRRAERIDAEVVGRRCRADTASRSTVPCRE
ncbi:hypothetical protein WDV91_16115 [Curtobacterium flaccumfaciens pv. flaccumfaciens]